MSTFFKSRYYQSSTLAEQSGQTGRHIDWDDITVTCSYTALLSRSTCISISIVDIQSTKNRVCHCTHTFIYNFAIPHARMLVHVYTYTDIHVPRVVCSRGITIAQEGVMEPVRNHTLCIHQSTNCLQHCLQKNMYKCMYCYIQVYMKMHVHSTLAK